MELDRSCPEEKNNRRLRCGPWDSRACSRRPIEVEERCSRLVCLLVLREFRSDQNTTLWAWPSSQFLTQRRVHPSKP